MNSWIVPETSAREKKASLPITRRVITLPATATSWSTSSAVGQIGVQSLKISRAMAGRKPEGVGTLADGFEGLGFLQTCLAQIRQGW